MVLSDRECMVLYGLVRWPGFSDLELGDRLGLGRSTVTVIRKRLQDKGLYRGFYVPDFRRVGCELLTILYGEFAGTAKGGVDVLKESIRDGVSTVFYMVNSGGQHLSLGAAGSLTHVREHIINHHRIHHESGYLTDKRHNYVFFPLKLTQIPRFFDYAPLLADHFNLEHERDDCEFKVEDGGWRPSGRELNTMRSLVDHPDTTDERVAAHAGVSRQTVNTLRNRFLDRGLLKPVRIPDVRKLGFGLLSFTHLHMSPHVSVEERKPHTRRMLEDPSHVLKVSGDLESILLSVHRDYTGYRDSHGRTMKAYKGGRLLSGEPVTHLYPLDRTDHIIEHSYGNIVAG
ncbi:MAG: hypothetical protein GF416_07780 [Candidatus Altiarchaeales archaeon]|nr:hypothetical protein [Candidatus Altiarchaeales archaeon]MBD3417012.1 hypothetical protein [Candidatus Altiarchaeales archaeon]